MPSFSRREIAQVRRSARNLSFDAPAVRVENFVSRELGLSAAQRASYLDPDGLAQIVAELSRQREEILSNDARLPGYVVYLDGVYNVSRICGLFVYLRSRGVDDVLIARLRHHGDVRSQLVRMRTGHDLEALAAAMLDSLVSSGMATRASGDQGLDAVGWGSLLPIDHVFVDGDFQPSEVLPGARVFALVSSKQYRFSGSRDVPGLVDPKFIRELVGGWLIQRSGASDWRRLGMKMLSPIQVILATTYRLSAASKELCRSLGVQVWGLPELIYLLCQAAPDRVFDPADGYHFSRREFGQWWRPYHLNRLAPVG